MFWGQEKLYARIKVRRLKTRASPEAMFDALSRRSRPVMLDSAAFHRDMGRYTILACRPMDTLTLDHGTLSDGRGREIAAGATAIWNALKEAFHPVRLTQKNTGCPYTPGWFGYVGYEVGRYIERLPCRARADVNLPEMHLGFYDAILVYDALEKQWRLVELVFDRPPPGAGLARRALIEIASGAGGDYVPVGASDAACDAGERPMAAAKANFSPQQYKDAVARCVDYIAAGDIFQANLSQRFTVRDAPPRVRIYKALRRRNPAWFAAYMSFEHRGSPCGVISSSPELFMYVRDGLVTTRPIKGTRRRTGQRTIDSRAQAELLSSAKDNAELAMIIDLLRNDMGRVCRYGSVRVTEARTLEAHPTVFHLVGTVTGRLRDGVGPASLLKATFPGGSITGAPKIRAMEIIDELEPCARGVYTGCIGTVGVDGACAWNIAIRTIVWDSSTAYVQAGGGIVADSDPCAEYQETLDKARALLEAIAAARTTPAAASTRRV